MASNPPPLRIPILHTGKVVDENGMATPAELAYRQSLTDSLQNYVGNQGLVAPTQSSANIASIAANTNPSSGAYTCQYGTIIYNSTNNTVQIAINNGSGAPVFKTVTLT